MAGALRGRFIPKNPSKYAGNVNKIIFRSSWELRFMKWLDENTAVIRWGSEELAIPYVNPIKVDATGRPVISRYFPDFIIMYKDTMGNIKKEIIEVKPMKEAVLSPKMSERDKLAYAVNQAKWKAASIFAESQGAIFRVITEHTMFRQSPKQRKTK